MSDLTYVLQPEDIWQLAADIRSGAMHHGPFYLEIHVTNRCNSNCYFCNQRWLKYDSRELGLAHFKQIVSRLIREDLRAVRFSGGGEPTTHPHINEMLDLVCESGLTIARFDTNGLLLTPDISRKLIKGRLKNLHISMQASTPRSWARVTKLRLSDFQVVVQNIRDFLKIDSDRKTYVYASFGVDEPTFDQLESMVRLCEKLGIHCRIHDLNAHAYSDHFRTVCLPILKDQLAAVITPDNKHCFRFSNLPSLGAFIETSFPASKLLAVEPKTDVACLAPWVGVLIRANGQVYLCCALSEGKHILGNVFEQDIMDIWHGSAFDRVREEAKNLYFQDSFVDARGKEEAPYLEKRYCRDCPVKQGLFSERTLGRMFQGRSDQNHFEAPRSMGGFTPRG